MLSLKIDLMIFGYALITGLSILTSILLITSTIIDLNVDLIAVVLSIIMAVKSVQFEDKFTNMIANYEVPCDDSIKYIIPRQLWVRIRRW